MFPTVAPSADDVRDSELQGARRLGRIHGRHRRRKLLNHRLGALHLVEVAASTAQQQAGQHRQQRRLGRRRLRRRWLRRWWSGRRQRRGQRWCCKCCAYCAGEQYKQRPGSARTGHCWLQCCRHTCFRSLGACCARVGVLGRVGPCRGVTLPCQSRTIQDNGAHRCNQRLDSVATVTHVS